MTAVLNPDDRLVFNATGPSERNYNRVFLNMRSISASNGYIYVKREIDSDIKASFSPPKLPKKAIMYISSSDEDGLRITTNRGVEIITVPKLAGKDLDSAAHSALYNSMVRQSVSEEMGVKSKPFCFAVTAGVLKKFCECFESGEILYFAVRSPDEVFEVSGSKTQGLLMPVKTISDTWEHVKWLSRDLVMEEMAKTMKGEAK